MRESEYYEVKQFGRTVRVRLEYGEYLRNNTLAVSLRFEPPIDDDCEDLQQEMLATITVNLPESRSLPSGTQFVDVNNHPWAYDWLIDNSIAEPTGIIAQSGFCFYPAFRFKHAVAYE